MKLRLHRNSVRLRLTQPDVRQLIVQGRVEESVAFGAPAPTRLAYALEVSDDVRNVVCEFADGRLVVRVPSATAAAWARSEEVSIQSPESHGNGNNDTVPLKVLIEKDFRCLHGPASADESIDDYYPNPQTA